MKKLFLFFIFCFVCQLSAQEEQKPFVVIIPSYKNEQWVSKNLGSVLSQNYDNFRVIYIDDISPDNTYEMAKNFLAISPKGNKVTLIKNSVRQGALANLYYAIYSCANNEIVVTLDGDDWLAHDNVLNILNRYYSDNNVWLTYGQYQHSDGRIGWCEDIPDEIIKNNSYRTYPCTTSHLRTFYAWLFKSIKKEDLLYNGEFFPMGWDAAMMYPMIEMTGGRFKFIPDILYIYNIGNPINDHKVDWKLQHDLAAFVRAKPVYSPLIKSPIEE